MKKLLFVDDDIHILKSNSIYFSNEGYDVMVSADAKSAIGILSDYKPDCIILDVMMPEINGFKLLRQIRKSSLVPIIFLSGCIEEDVKLEGLLAGGSDYITKPYSIKELLVRIEVLLRDTVKTGTSPSVLEINSLTLDVLSHKVYYQNKEIPLSKIEYKLLYLLTKNADEIISTNYIGETIWGYYDENNRKTIAVAIGRLRKKLEEYANLTDFIVTVWGKGYKLRTSSR